MPRLPPATGFFLFANIAVYLVLVAYAGSFDLPVPVLVSFGGLVPANWMGAEYWRYLSYGFLHGSLLHVTVNSFCLLAWGTPLERWFGSVRLTLLYLGSIVLAGLGSVALLTGPFVTIGASGGISGLLGGLLLLWLLRIIAMPASFFVVNIGLNVVIALSVSGVDWQAHLAGFAGGIVLTGLILAGRAFGPRR